MAHDKTAHAESPPHHGHGSDSDVDQTTGPLFLAGCIGLTLFLSLAGGAAPSETHDGSSSHAAHPEVVGAAARSHESVRPAHEGRAPAEAAALAGHPQAAPNLNPAVAPAQRPEEAPMVHADWLAAPQPTPASPPEPSVTPPATKPEPAKPPTLTPKKESPAAAVSQPASPPTAPGPASSPPQSPVAPASPPGPPVVPPSDAPAPQGQPSHAAAPYSESHSR